MRNYLLGTVACEPDGCTKFEGNSTVTMVPTRIIITAHGEPGEAYLVGLRFGMRWQLASEIPIELCPADPEGLTEAEIERRDELVGVALDALNNGTPYLFEIRNAGSRRTFDVTLRGPMLGV